MEKIAEKYGVTVAELKGEAEKKAKDVKEEVKEVNNCNMNDGAFFTEGAAFYSRSRTASKIYGFFL